MPETPKVEPGSVWADNDSRCEGRTLRVDAIDGGKALCTILTNSADTQQIIDRGGNRNVQDMRGRTTKISLSRFRPTSTGYRLVADAPKEG